MATGYFQGFLSVLQFYIHQIGIKYGLHFSNQGKIKMLFNTKLIYDILIWGLSNYSENKLQTSLFYLI